MLTSVVLWCWLCAHVARVFGWLGCYVKVITISRFFVVFDIDLNQTDLRATWARFAPDQENPELPWIRVFFEMLNKGCLN